MVQQKKEAGPGGFRYRGHEIQRIVLFYVYPLKVLFSLLFGDRIYGDGRSPFSIRRTDDPRAVRHAFQDLFPLHPDSASVCLQFCWRWSSHRVSVEWLAGSRKKISH